MIVLLIISLLFGDKKLSSKPLKANAITVSETAIIVDKKDGFYQSIDSAISPDGKVVILDRGNFLIHIFDSKGKKIRAFGKEGSGPGELTNAGAIEAFNERILLNSFQRISIFDYKGKLIKEIKTTNFGGGELTQTESGYKYLYNPANNPEFLSIEYDLDGNLVEQIKNKEHKEVSNQRGLESFLDNYEQNFKKPRSFKPFHNGYIQIFQGDYKFQYLDKNANLIDIYSRDFTRIKDDNLQSPISFRSGPNTTKKQKEQMQKTMDNMRAMQVKLTGGYLNDIIEIVGVYKDFLFLRTPATNKTQFLIDVIDKNFNYYTQIKLEDKDLKWATISHGKILIELENDDIGPYVKVMDITVN